ncbi:DUF4102 domain-containing protein [Pusillimonas harenae]|uniref:DUF4102 domain-containing protein n=1 Tax=Pollutimonas harenae TaxID=657015 RepID=A0A853GPQ6_9BURK|nr:DUF4102 domain-containing protein [Pollutimonas harenae]TEA72606.1 DUF4102 domain-containing protein [Pollutimonas harenae]
MSLLSETQIRAAKPDPKEYMLNDGDKLYLRVRATGQAWIYPCMWNGKSIKLGMGPYPSVTLVQARAKAYEANSQRANGLDPKEVQDQLWRCAPWAMTRRKKSQATASVRPLAP